MRYYKLIIFFAIILIILPSVVFADHWNEYMAIRNNFYYLNKLDFNNISCKIEVPLISNMLTQMRQQFASLPDNIAIRDNLNDFSLSYSKSSGLTINEPDVNIEILSEKGMADPSRVKNGVNMTNSGFEQQINGVSEQIKGLFGGYEYPQKTAYHIKQVELNNSSNKIVYEREGTEVTEIYSGTQVESKQIGRGIEILSKENYEKAHNGKLIMKSAHVTINQPTGTIEMESSLSYQRIGSIDFPDHISNKFTQHIQSLKQEGQIDIYLKQCSYD